MDLEIEKAWETPPCVLFMQMLLAGYGSLPISVLFLFAAYSIIIIRQIKNIIVLLDLIVYIHRN